MVEMKKELCNILKIVFGFAFFFDTSEFLYAKASSQELHYSLLRLSSMVPKRSGTSLKNNLSKEPMPSSRSQNPRHNETETPNNYPKLKATSQQSSVILID
jgi:hypothetical protein